METWELVARESIRDLIGRYNANGDSGRFDPMLELFAEDATMELPTGVHQGRAEIRAMFEGVASAPEQALRQEPNSFGTSPRPTRSSGT